MINRSRQAGVLTTLSILSMAMASVSNAEEITATRFAKFQVVGYLPDYRVADLDPAVSKHLTDIIFFSVIPEPRGEFVSTVFDSPDGMGLRKILKEDYRVKVHLCVGGADRSQGFAEIAATEASRHLFATGLSAYCSANRYDGADLDWEHPKDDAESQNYGILLAEISKAFKPHGLELTAAIAGWQILTPAAIEAVDGINLMSYDGDGRHSTFELAQSEVHKLLKAGLPAAKMRLGLPFYGRGIVQRDLTKTYGEIQQAGPDSVDQNEVDGLYFNGPQLIRQKTQFARDQRLGGVMVWEIGQDARGDKSLLKVIDQAKLHSSAPRRR